MSAAQSGKRIDLGRCGEQFAVQYLERSLGWRIEARNWRCRAGELDIVGNDGGVLVVVEVRTRRGPNYGTPEDSVGPQKIRQLQRVARHFLAQTGRAGECTEVRFDMIAIVVEAGLVAAFRHHRDVVDGAGAVGATDL